HRIQLHDLAMGECLPTRREVRLVAKAVEELAGLLQSEPPGFCVLQHRQHPENGLVLAPFARGADRFGEQSCLFIKANCRCADASYLRHLPDGHIPLLTLELGFKSSACPKAEFS